MRDGTPDKIDGFQYWVNNDMPDTLEAGAKVILFGDFNRYVIRMVNDIVLKRADERYIEFDQTAWVAFMRLDGRCLNTSAIKYLGLAAS
jgi:HK97 family phage major capsid protein